MQHANFIHSRACGGSLRHSRSGRMDGKQQMTCRHLHPQSVEAAKSFTCQTFESSGTRVMDRPILGPGLRQRDPVGLPSSRRWPRPKLVRRKEPPEAARCGACSKLTCCRDRRLYRESSRPCSCRGARLPPRDDRLSLLECRRHRCCF